MGVGNRYAKWSKNACALSTHDDLAAKRFEGICEKFARRPTRGKVLV
jgi:hypothetical protein